MAEQGVESNRPASELAESTVRSVPRFDDLVAEYEKKIFNLVYRVIGDYDEAADLTQETFISAYRAWDRFRGEAKVYTWLYQIALNHCRNRLRQRGRARAIQVESLDQPFEPDDSGSGAGKDIPDESQAPHIVLEDKELNQKILAAVQSLPPAYREIVILRELKGLSYNEIVEVTGISLDNVKTRLSRARAMLRRKLEHYYRG
jgi:RNA polymerase sigma-70 factor (ECF subfamily)